MPSADAILMLASHEYERLPHVAALARRMPDAHILLTEPAVPTPLNCFDCAFRVHKLVSAGVAPDRIHMLDAPVRNSYDELRAGKTFAAAYGWRSLLVVTSPYHTRRVRVLAGAVPGALPEVGVVAAAVPGGTRFLWWSRRYDRRYVVYESAALVANSWRLGIWPWRWGGFPG